MAMVSFVNSLRGVGGVCVGHAMCAVFPTVLGCLEQGVRHIPHLLVVLRLVD